MVSADSPVSADEGRAGFAVECMVAGDSPGCGIEARDVGSCNAARVDASGLAMLDPEAGSPDPEADTPAVSAPEAGRSPPCLVSRSPCGGTDDMSSKTTLEGLDGVAKSSEQLTISGCYDEETLDAGGGKIR